MMAILLTFLRLSSDNELIALKSGGVSFYRLLPPVFLFSFFGFILTGFMTIFGVPWGNVSLEKLALNVMASNADIGLKERTFNDAFDNVMLYVSRIDTQSKKLIDIFIEVNVYAAVIAHRCVVFDVLSAPALYFGTNQLVRPPSGTAWQTGLGQ